MLLLFVLTSQLFAIILVAISNMLGLSLNVAVGVVAITLTCCFCAVLSGSVFKSPLLVFLFFKLLLGGGKLVAVVESLAA